MTLTKLMLALTACLTLIACEPCDPGDHGDHGTWATDEFGDCEPGESECVCEPSEPYPSCDNPLYACVDDVSRAIPARSTASARVATA